VHELRCDHGIKFGELFIAEGVIAFKCKSRRCGAGTGVVVVHEFETETGKLLETRLYREPGLTREDV